MLITNSKIIPWTKPNKILFGKAVRIKDGKIFDLGDEKELLNKYPEDEILDGNGQFLMPGLICAHTHFYSAFSRGMGIPGNPPENFPQILEKLWWPLDRSLTHQDIFLSALVSIIDAIKHGTTTLIDHHASPGVIDGSLDIIADAVAVSGVRASLCYEVTDRNGHEQATAGIKENVRFIKKINQTTDNELLSASFGLHASLTLSEDTLERCRSEVPDGSGFHIHVAEHESDEYDSLQKTGLRVVERLYKHGLLGNKTIAVHCVNIDAKEMEIIRDTKTWVTHQPRSNMNNAVGLPRVEEMLNLGIPVCIGNDGFSNTMWEEWKTTYLSHKLINRDPRRMKGSDVVQMGVYNNSDLVNTLFSNQKLGRIEIGSSADLILVDYFRITDLTADNLPWHILFGFNESMVTTTIVNGKILMKDRVLTTVDEKQVSRQALENSKEVWERYKKLF